MMNLTQKANNAVTKATTKAKNEPLYIGVIGTLITSGLINQLFEQLLATLVSYGITITPQAEQLFSTIVSGIVLLLGLAVTRQYTSPAWKLKFQYGGDAQLPGAPAELEIPPGE